MFFQQHFTYLGFFLLEKKNRTIHGYPFLLPFTAASDHFRERERENGEEDGSSSYLLCFREEIFYIS